MVNAARLARNASLTVLALGLATLAWGSGFDRMTRAAPRLAQIVPEALRANAWRAEATRALEQDPNRAEALAARAVVADPIDPASSSLLGAVLTKFDTSHAANRYSEYYGTKYYDYDKGQVSASR